MNKSIIKYIFGLLLTTALFMVGCGSSSSNNPVSTGSINSGMVNVKGNVTNLSGNGTVSFYTPSAAIMSNFTANTSLRASSSLNGGVYTFNVDEKGNYNGQIPVGDYYVIAQNADGSMKSVSAIQSYNSSIRSSETITEVPTIKLFPTIDVKVNLITTSISSSLTPVGQMVYIENAPFIANADESGGFTIKSVPEGVYTFCSNIWDNNYRYHFSQQAAITASNKVVELSNPVPISISGENITGQVVDSEGNNISKSVAVTVVTASNEIYTVKSDDFGKFVMPISNTDKTNALAWFVDKVLAKIGGLGTDNKLAYVKPTSEEGTSSSEEEVNKYTIKINRRTDFDSYLGDLDEKEKSITLFKLNSSNEIISSYTEIFYNVQNSYTMSVEKGEYLCMMRTENKAINCNTFGFAKCNVQNDDSEVVFNYITALQPLKVKVENGKYSFSEDFIDAERIEEINNEEFDGKLKKIPFVGYTVSDSTEPIIYDTGTINTYNIDLSFIKEEDGNGNEEERAKIYDIYCGYSIRYNGDAVATITSDPVPYVKH